MPYRNWGFGVFIFSYPLFPLLLLFFFPLLVQKSWCLSQDYHAKFLYIKHLRITQILCKFKCMKTQICKYRLNIISPEWSDKNPLVIFLILLVMTLEVHRRSITAKAWRTWFLHCQGWGLFKEPASELYNRQLIFFQEVKTESPPPPLYSHIQKQTS